MQSYWEEIKYKDGAFMKKGTQQMIDTRANQMYNPDPGDPYNPTQMESYINWGDAWDAADAYGLYYN